MTRRDLLRLTGNGFGMLGLANVLAGQGSAAEFAPTGTHFPAKAKHVIFLFLTGGPSHVDTFDPKPALDKYSGQIMPGAETKGEPKKILASPFKFARHGQSGLDVSELFPHLASVIDDVCVVRSMHTDLPAHPQAVMQMNSGHIIPGFPSWGSWLTYGLGTENRNLPGFITMCPGMPHVGPELWSSGFLPAAHQGTFVPCDEVVADRMIQNLTSRHATSAEQRKELDLINALNRLAPSGQGQDSQLEARIQAMEMAFRMQTEALDAFDVSKEKPSTLADYGVPERPVQSESKMRSATRDGDFARGCLIARRLVERGVRVVQVYFGEDIPWDSHHDILVHRKLAYQSDRPIAALIRDLKTRGLLNETIVMVGGEFGRTPWVESTGRINVQNGRNHNGDGFTYLLAGGGFKGGMAHGATDDFGWKSVEKKVHVHDLHATVLHQMGLDHKRLTYRHSGRDHRLTDVAGNVVKEIIA
jgi:hypothetical protein